MGKRKPHVVVIAWPVQGHVMPLMKFSLKLLQHGCRVTFVTTDSAHDRIMNACTERDDDDDDDELQLQLQLRLVSIPGEEIPQDENKSGIFWPFMVKNVEKFLEETITTDGDGITCLVVDQCIGLGPEIAVKMGIPLAVFFPGSALWLALALSIPKLIDDGVILSDGTPKEHQMIQLSPTSTTPAMINTKNLPWVCFGNENGKRTVFETGLRSREAAEKADWFFCNSTFDLEPTAFAFIPKLMPIGPLMASSRHGNPAGNFWPEDQACLEWLNQQPPCSVIYAAFGSLLNFSQTQFQELALGLKLSNMPFLWVVRPDSKNEGYPDRVVAATQGGGGGDGSLIVGWAPQRKVLGHPSVACFMSHCGWNSTIEGVSNGVPFLCWPYFADQFLNRTYICDVWKVGVGLNPDNNGIITREEIKTKVEQLFGDQEFRSRAVNLKEKAMDSVKEGGPSYNNFYKFVQWLKA